MDTDAATSQTRTPPRLLGAVGAVDVTLGGSLLASPSSRDTATILRCVLAQQKPWSCTLASDMITKLLPPQQRGRNKCVSLNRCFRYQANFGGNPTSPPYLLRCHRSGSASVCHPEKVLGVPSWGCWGQMVPPYEARGLHYLSAMKSGRREERSLCRNISSSCCCRCWRGWYRRYDAVLSYSPALRRRLNASSFALLHRV